MTFLSQALISNKSNLLKGEIVKTFPADHIFSKNESMQEFLNSGGLFENWSRTFSILKFKDKTQEEIEYLEELNASGERKYYFTEPETGTDECNALYYSGEIEIYLSDALPFLQERT